MSFGISKEVLLNALIDSISHISDETLIKIYDSIISGNLNPSEVFPLIINELRQRMDESSCLIPEEGLDSMIGSTLSWVVVLSSIVGVIVSFLRVLVYILV